MRARGERLTCVIVLFDNYHKGGITHAFVVLFKNLADRDYYVSKDPVHLEFAKTLGDSVDTGVLRVVDFAQGKF